MQDIDKQHLAFSVRKSWQNKPERVGGRHAVYQASSARPKSFL